MDYSPQPEKFPFYSLYFNLVRHDFQGQKQKFLVYEDRRVY